MPKPRTSPQAPRQRTASRYKRSETSRLVKGLTDAGLTVRSIEIDPSTGVLRVLVGNPDEKAPPPADGTVIETADELRKLL